MKFSELEDASKLATREWVEQELNRLKAGLNLDRLQRQSKLMNYAGLIGFGLIWGFILAEFAGFLLLRK
jgi:hypothetical protein